MPLSITGSRLRNQRLSGAGFSKPEDVVSWLGAVQAQEYADAKWALALRMRRATETGIERAFAEGRILRTHVMRPTWHFVTPGDIRWMLALTGPRVSAAMAPYNRRLELDSRVFRRSQRAIVKALRGGTHLTRQELKTVLHRAGVPADDVQRLAHIVMQAELAAVICSGVRRGKQSTYALLDERVPSWRTLSRDEALATLASRYFTSHGPAQLQDFAWWSGLTMADARRGLAMVERTVNRDVIDGKTYWRSSSGGVRTGAHTACLLPLFDEYLIAYKDRSAALDPSRWTRAAPRDPFSASVLVNGQVVGGWKRVVTSQRAFVTITPFRSITRSDKSAIADAAAAYSVFLARQLDMSWKP